MALKGAKVALRQLDNLAKYRAKNIDRIRAQNRAYLAKKHGRKRSELPDGGTLAKKRGGSSKVNADAPGAIGSGSRAAAA
jgi:hypothetical protein